MSRKKVFVALEEGTEIYNELWSDSAEATARESGYEFAFMQDGADNWLQLAGGCSALITSWPSPVVDSKALAGLAGLEIIGHAAGSVADHIMPEVFSKGIKVVSANNIMAAAVAEWSVMMSLVGVRKIARYAKVGASDNFCWRYRADCSSLRGKVVGIWGYGAVARRLITMLKVFSPQKIMVASDFLTESEAAAVGVEKVTLEQVLGGSDVIHLLESLVDDTRDRIGRIELGMIRDDAVLINAGRAGLIEERAFYDELIRERFETILDVYYQEPLDVDNRLLKLRRTTCTPHNAGRPSRELFVAEIIQEFERHFNGQPLEHELSAERAQAMTSKKAKDANYIHLGMG